MSNRSVLLAESAPDAVYGFSNLRVLETVTSPHQRIEVCETPALGRLFRLDGRFMTSERDEFIYHECMVHPAAFAHGAPRRALVLGGGDGGAARQLLKHPSIEQVVIAELDAQVVAMARRHLQRVHGGALDDPRVELRLGDAAAFVAEAAAAPAAERFDLAVFDLTPPDSPARGLYTGAFFAELKRVLAPRGIASLHLGAPFLGGTRAEALAAALRAAFAHVAVLCASIPLYGGLWAMAAVSDALDVGRAEPATTADGALADLRYYDPAQHRALFALPRYLRGMFSA